MKKTIVILLLISSYLGFSQEKSFYDFIVLNNNDTIYGKYQTNIFLDLKGKKYKIKKNKIKNIKKNEKIYNLTLITKEQFYSKENDSLISLENENISAFKKEEKLYLHNLKRSLRKDYILNIEKDTTYGEIKNRNSINKYEQIINEKGLKIDPKNILEFRMEGFNYYYKEKRKINPSDKKQAYLKLIYKGKVNLYEYKTLVTISGFSSQVETHYYLEKDKTLTLLNPRRFYQIIKRILPENIELHNMIKKRKFNYKDIYLVIKYHNEY